MDILQTASRLFSRQWPIASSFGYGVTLIDLNSAEVLHGNHRCLTMMDHWVNLTVPALRQQPQLSIANKIPVSFSLSDHNLLQMQKKLYYKYTFLQCQRNFLTWNYERKKRIFLQNLARVTSISNWIGQTYSCLVSISLYSLDTHFAVLLVKINLHQNEVHNAVEHTVSKFLYHAQSITRKEMYSLSGKQDVIILLTIH